MIQKDILCALSGGGFRATFFHAGVLRGLIRLGLKDRIKVISSVSGGSITSALFGLKFDEIATIDDFDRLVINPLVEFSNRDPRNILIRYRLKSVVNSVASTFGSLFGSFGKPLMLLEGQENSELFIEQLDKYIFKGCTLSALSKNVRVVINATNLNNGARFRFDNNDFGDYKIGYSREIHHLPISQAVMASACYPGLFSPIKLNIGQHKFFLRDKFKNDACSPNMVPESIYLSDGGLFDNLGYYSIKSELDRGRDGFIVISDAANRFNNDNYAYGFANSLLRISDILMEQVSNRDRSKIMDNLLKDIWKGIYFKLENSCRWYREFEHEKCAKSSDVPDFGWSDSIVSRIAQIRTDLNRFNEHERKCLIYHGETLVETTVSKWNNAQYKEMSKLSHYQPPTELQISEKSILEELKNSHKRF
ncbi:patatin-like phospholipase family protein [Pelosinus propionicus]|uniref:Predicted acylesterase/phospholipase RssA, contains patatin domain n=1 Tax=Pelosinus propionicus DSM 13327 TaxID=1123291 RepID=A0A1I4PGP0_9FIRM|nr:patatin-like phospholipase family protein [Pelosinus propionicus]SFM26780.1 Predicted acylesterase/phospholipase RssA, contains patatin domain [Pelosinus propionicus DSM 13327]